MKLISGSIISILIIISLLFSAACSTSQDTPSNELKGDTTLQEYERLALEKLKENYTIEMNSDKNYVLCIKREKLITGKSYGSIQYFIYDISKGEIIFEESIGNGNVNWLNENQLKIDIVPGIVKGNEESSKNDLGYIYDLKLRKKIYNSDFQDKFN